MCGIAGIWHPKGEPVAPEVIDRFTDSLAHRGPDGRGTWHDATRSVALGHRRLAILDLSADGAQPMSYADGRYRLTYNGEIYNFLELRSELEGHGHRFRSSSDTEVLLASYAQWGPDALLRLNGMWALALFDTVERQLFLARDRFGIKPLLYVSRPDLFAFASELKAFRHLRGFVTELDVDVARRSLARPHETEGTRQTLVRGVQRLPGGHFLIVDRDGAREQRWWRTIDHLESVPAELEAQAEVFRDRFGTAVRLRARSDVPIATCLSGGFDSSAVVCTLADVSRTTHEARRANDWQRAFVATFPGASNDERAKAETVAAWAGVRPHLLPVTESVALQDIDQILLDLDDLYPTLVTAPWMIYREVRRAGVTVTLDGHGGDELLAGYPPLEWQFFHDAPSLWHPLQNAARLWDYRRSLHASFQRAGTAIGVLEPLRAMVRNHPTGRALTRVRSRPDWLSDERRAAPSPIPSDEDPLPADWGRLTRRLYRLFHGTLLPTILRNFDRVSMAHGVEIRMPFMDYRLVTYAFSLPDRSKVSGTRTKVVAAEAMRGRMPEPIRTSRSKVGFVSPLPEWLRGPLVPWARQLLSDAASTGSPLLDVAALTKRFDDTAAAGSWTWQNSETMWLSLNALWFERNFLAHR